MKDTIELVLFTGYAGVFFTPEMKKIVAGKEFPYSRMGKLVDYIRNTAMELETPGVFPISDNVNVIYRQEARRKWEPTYYYCYDSTRNLVVTMQIVSVDISKKWTIQTYDGAESLRYLEPKVLDRSLNYCEY